MLSLGNSLQAQICAISMKLDSIKVVSKSQQETQTDSDELTQSQPVLEPSKVPASPSSFG